MCLLVTYSGVRSSDHEIYHLFDLFVSRRILSLSNSNIFEHLDNYLPPDQITLKHCSVVSLKSDNVETSPKTFCDFYI